MDIAEYQKDYSVPDQVRDILYRSQQLFEMLDDTTMAAGSDIMEVSNIYFNSVKQAARDGQPGAQAIYDDLKSRYPGRPPKHPATFPGS